MTAVGQCSVIIMENIRPGAIIDKQRTLGTGIAQYRNRIIHLSASQHADSDIVLPVKEFNPVKRSHPADKMRRYAAHPKTDRCIRTFLP